MSVYRGALGGGKPNWEFFENFSRRPITHSPCDRCLYVRTYMRELGGKGAEEHGHGRKNRFGEFRRRAGLITSLKGINGMGKDFKYKMRHIGDAFADQVENLGHAAKESVRGITLAYNIDGLEKEKTKIITGIGVEMVSAGRCIVIS